MNTKATKEWLESAERDRDTVYILLESSNVPYEIVAFHCQQCAEKYLKAIFVLHSRKMPFVHDLLKLCRDVKDVCTSLENVETECERLTPFGTITRYPGSSMQPDANHMPHVSGWMEAIRSAVLPCIEKLPPKK